MENYIVKQGDTLQDVAKLFNIAAYEIIRANSLTAPYKLEEGTSLTIPTGRFNIFNYYTVKKGDTLYRIATDNNITVDLLAAINGLDKDEYIYPNQTILVPKPEVEIYITKEGDTLEDLTNKFNSSIEDIIYSNNNIYLLSDQLLVNYKNLQS